MTAYILKTSTAPAVVTFDWDDGSLLPGETVESDLGWVLTPETATPSLSVVGANTTATATSATLAGGRPGDVYRVAATIRTTAGRELVRAVTLRVGDN